MLLGGNSYVITLQKLCYYIAKAMLLRYNNYDFIIQKNPPYSLVNMEDLYLYLYRYGYYFLFKKRSACTAQATVQPTIGLLPMPRKPIIST